MDCSPPGSSVMGFSRQEYRSGLPYPLPEDLPNPGIESESLTYPALAGGCFTISITWEAPKTNLLGFYYISTDPGEGKYLIPGSNHSISQLSKSMPQPVTLKKLKLNGSMKTYKTF